MRRALGIILWVAVVLWAIGGWAVVALIAYNVKQNVTMNGKKQELTAADISTWVRGPDGWACYAHSETLLQDAKGS